MNKLDNKTNLLNHSEAKVKLLGEYIKRYLNIISNDKYTKSIHIYDLFCGQGEYDNGGHGSPLVMLKYVKQTYYTIIDKKQNKLPKINCTFNDIDKEKILVLKKSIQENCLHYPTIGSIQFSSNDYNLEISKLKQKFQKFTSEKAFVFIDPYGYKEVRANDIRDLLGTKRKSEILLWLPIQFMYRFAEEGTPEVLRNFMSELNIGIASKSTQNVWGFIEVLKEGFQNYLGDSFFVDHFSLRKEENTVFCLFFFTSHIKGFEKMLESKWEIDTEEGRGWEFRGNLPSLFFDQKINKLQDLLLTIMEGRKMFNSDLYQFTLRNGYLPKHATEVLQSLQKSGRLEVFLVNGQKARKNSFYIKYCNPEDLDYKKVFYQIK